MELVAHSTEAKKTLCDKINLNTFNKLQPYGVLLIIDRKNFNVIQYSENAAEYLETPIEKIHKNPVVSFLSKTTQQDDLATWLVDSNNRYGRFLWNGEKNQIEIWVYVHQQEECILLEIERTQNINLEDKAFSVFDEIINSKNTLSSNSMEEYANITCEKIRSITEYDRVILYKFKNDFSGVVIGESKKNEMDSYIGLHFPATDVPAAVRAMYIRQPLRYIPDSESHTISLQDNPFSKKKISIDLTTILLRSVAPVHIKYIKNMGVTSSLSIAILHNQTLWGLIACHHAIPKYLSLYYRFGLLVLSKVLGERLVLMESNKYNDAISHTAHTLNLIDLTIQNENNIFSILNNTKEKIYHLFSADSVAFYYNNKFVTYGETPSEEQLQHLIEWLFNIHNNKLFYTHELPVIFPECKAFHSNIAGLLAIPVTPDKKNYLLVFRKEILSTVSWAGNPHSTIIKHKNDYSPRHSFEAWKETIALQSEPWKQYEINVAKELQASFTAKQLQILLEEQAKKDPLTGLYNRRLLNDILFSEMSDAKKNKRVLAIVMMDLDFFKKINDTYGHAAGDLVLINAAKILENISRKGGYAFRYGGEEFLLILSDTTTDDIIHKAEEILQKVRTMEIQLNNGILTKISASIGISFFPAHGEQPDQLIQMADEALYKAKSTGRDKFVIFNSSPDLLKK